MQLTITNCSGINGHDSSHMARVKVGAVVLLPAGAAHANRCIQIRISVIAFSSHILIKGVRKLIWVDEIPNIFKLKCSSDRLF